MALTDDDITAKNFQDFYNKIKPYLNGGGMGMKLLWENGDPTQAFSAGDITLSSNDYDVLIVMGYLIVPYAEVISSIVDSGSQLILNGVDRSTAKHTYVREITPSSKIVLSVSAGYVDGSQNNNACVPYRIYGIKVYNREDKGNTYSTSERIVGEWIDGKTLYQKTIDFGALPNETTKAVNSGLSNVTIRDIQVNCNSSSFAFTAPAITMSAGDSLMYINVYYRYETNVIQITTNADYSNTSAYVTLRYTKTA